MNKKQGFDLKLPIALGAGLAATLLLVSLRQGTVPALLLAYLSPLPLMIATLGFGQSTGLGAVGVAVLTFVGLSIAATPPNDLTLDDFVSVGLGGVIFAICEALPAWWLARLAALESGARVLPWRARGGDTDRSSKSSPVGLIVLHAALVGFLVVAVATVALCLDQASFRNAVDLATARITPMLTEALGAHELPKGFDVVKLARFIVMALPAMAATTLFLLLLLNLWLAGRVVQISNRLPRPWPDIARELRLPRLFGLVLIAAIGLCFVGGIIGLVASIAAAVLVVAFALQGLAVIHDLSRGGKFRVALLCLLYMTLALLMPWPLVAFALVGLFEAGFSLRDRKAAAAAPPPLT